MYSILNEWVCLFGWYKYISSDRGAAFIDKLNQRMHKLFGINFKLAEAQNYRSIGKVERVIRIVKNILQKWNIELENLFVEDKNITEASEAIIACAKKIREL